MPPRVWKSDSMYNRYAIASEADLRDGVRRLSQRCSNAVRPGTL